MNTATAALVGLFLVPPALIVAYTPWGLLEPLAAPRRPLPLASVGHEISDTETLVAMAVSGAAALTIAFVCVVVIIRSASAPPELETAGPQPRAKRLRRRCTSARCKPLAEDFTEDFEHDATFEPEDRRPL